MAVEGADRRKMRCVAIAPRTDEAAALFSELSGVLQFIGDEGVEFALLNPVGDYGSLVSETALQILSNIEGADAVLADLTGADPNVMYELGFAHALKKPVLPIVDQSRPGIPSDLSGYLYYAYDRADVHALAATLIRWMRRMSGEKTP